MALAAGQVKRRSGFQVGAVVMEQRKAQLLELSPVDIGARRMAQFGQLITQRSKFAEAARVTADSDAHFK